MELHAECEHARKHLHHDERHMGKREKILSGFRLDGDHRAAWLSIKVDRKRAELSENKEKLAQLDAHLHALAREIENTAAYASALKRAEKTYGLISWVEANNAVERVYYCAAALTVVSIGFFGMDAAWFLPPLVVFVSMVAARMIIDDGFSLRSLKVNLDALRGMPLHAVQGESLIKESQQTIGYA